MRSFMLYIKAFVILVKWLFNRKTINLLKKDLETGVYRDIISNVHVGTMQDYLWYGWKYYKKEQ